MVAGGVYDYKYPGNFLSLEGAVLSPAKPDFYVIYNKYTPQKITYQNEPKGSPGGLEDLFGAKKRLTIEELGLIKQDMKNRRNIAYEHLSKLYDELLQLDNWRLARPFPEFYSKDKLWWEINKSELQLKDQIRREKKDLARDIQFDKKDLRSSILDYKKQQQKEVIFGESLEGLV